MGRINVWVPDPLLGEVRAKLPDVNMSALLRAALEDQLSCEHDGELCCARCGSPVVAAELVDEALSGFYRDVMWELGNLVGRGGSAEGAARVLKQVATRWGVGAAARLPLPRATRAQRERVLDLRGDVGVV